MAQDNFLETAYRKIIITVIARITGSTTSNRTKGRAHFRIRKKKKSIIFFIILAAERRTIRREFYSIEGGRDQIKRVKRVAAVIISHVFIFDVASSKIHLKGEGLTSQSVY